MNALPPFDGPRMVTLLDGRQVWNDSDDWRHESEAREIAAWPHELRDAHLMTIERSRGADAAARLRKTIEEVIAVTAERAR